MPELKVANARVRIHVHKVYRQGDKVDVTVDVETCRAVALVTTKLLILAAESALKVPPVCMSAMVLGDCRSD